MKIYIWIKGDLELKVLAESPAHAREKFLGHYKSESRPSFKEFVMSTEPRIGDDVDLEDWSWYTSI